MPALAHTYAGDGQVGAKTPDEVCAALRAGGFELEPSRRLRRTRLDTFDGRLHDRGLRLEHRDGGPSREALVLTDGRSAAAELPIAPAGGAPPRFAADLVPGPFRTRLADAADVRALLPTLTIVGTATPAVRRNDDGKVVARAIVYDDLQTDRGASRHRWLVEIAGLTGYERAGADLGGLLAGIGLAPVDGDALDVLLDDVGVDRRGVAISPTVSLDSATPAIDGFRTVLANLHEAMVVNVPGTVDDLDPEFLHDLRVAVRRTRSVLSHARGVLPADVLATARASFGWLGDVTSPPRDLDVYQIEWASYVEGLPPGARADLEPLRAHLDGQRRAAHDALAVTLTGPRATDVLDGWRRWLDEPGADAVMPVDAGEAMGEVVARRIRKAQRRLIRRGRSIDDDTPAEEVHELRKDAKRLRYLLECFGGLYRGAPRKAFVQRLKALQDNLGTHQDADVHVAQLRDLTVELAESLPVGTVMASGQLLERLEQHRGATRAQFADRFADYDSKRTRRALRDLLATGH